MHLYNSILDLYTDYLMVSDSKVTSTGLSNALDGELSHDKITRFLSRDTLDSKDLWKYVKKAVRKLDSSEGVLIFDDSIEEKAYSDENDIICWHYDHSLKRNVKGVNQVLMLYFSKGVSIPVCSEIIKKTEKTTNKKTGKAKRISPKSKNDYFREHLKQCVDNNIQFIYALTDSWYSSVENMRYIKEDLKKDFVMAIKSNRLVCLSLDDKMNGRYLKISSLELKDATQVYIQGLDFPILLCKKVLKDQNEKSVDVYLVSSNLTLDTDGVFEIYQKRWKIEEFFKSMKSLSLIHI